jgi:probable F420-dependent oxidoreductase
MALADKARLGYPLPQVFIDGAVDLNLIRTIAEGAERYGFDSLWDQEQTLGHASALEPVSLLSAAAAMTSTVKLGVSVLVMARHDPVQLAKELASVDQLSGGRLIVGVGAGNRDVAPSVEGTPKDRRLLRLAEGVEVMKALWADGTATFAGKIWRLTDAPMNPKPAQRPHPPIWFGARAEPAIRRAVRHGDGWMGAGSSTADDFDEQLGLLRQVLESEGRDPATFAVSKRVYIAIDDDSARAERRLREWFGAYYGNVEMASRVSVWGPERIVQERLAAVADAGAEMILVSPVYDYVEHQEALASMWGMA